MSIFKLPNIPIAGEINSEMTKQVCFSLSELEAKKVKKLRIDINSPGGDVEDGIAIAVRIKNSPIHITTYGLGQVASSGLVVFSAGNRRIMSPYCMALFHEISAEVPGEKISNLQLALSHYENDNKRMIQLLADYSGVEKKVWSHLISIKNDYFFDAKKALELGFIHGIK